VAAAAIVAVVFAGLVLRGGIAGKGEPAGDRDKDEAAGKRRYDALNGVHPEYPYVVPGAVQSILEVLREDGKIKGSPPPQNFLDMSYLEAVEKERPASGQK